MTESITSSGREEKTIATENNNGSQRTKFLKTRCFFAKLQEKE